MIRFDYSIAPQAESVIIVAGGWSVHDNIQRIKEYQSKHNSTVFAANYNHKFPIHYTYFADPDKLIEQIRNIKSEIIVPPRLKSRMRVLRKTNYFVIKLQPSSPSIYVSSRVQIEDDGTFPYCLIGTAGLASIVVSMLCRPKRMLLVGFDGSTPDARYKRMFNGSKVAYNKPAKRVKEISYLTNSLMPALHERGITVDTFENVLFYGIPKAKLGINVV